jgi:hypothetical protein
VRVGFSAPEPPVVDFVVPLFEPLLPPELLPLFNFSPSPQNVSANVKTPNARIDFIYLFSPERNEVKIFSPPSRKIAISKR